MCCVRGVSGSSMGMDRACRGNRTCGGKHVFPLCVLRTAHVLRFEDYCSPKLPHTGAESDDGHAVIMPLSWRWLRPLFCGLELPQVPHNKPGP